MDNQTRPSDEERYLYSPPSEVALSQEQIENLRKLSAKLKAVDDAQFSMNDWFDSDLLPGRGSAPVRPPTESDYAPKCGTVACACGWGPAAGVPIRGWERWRDYAHRAFGAHEKSNLFDWLFNPFQGGTAKDAAQRIDVVLEMAGAHA